MKVTYFDESASLAEVKSYIRNGGLPSFLAVERWIRSRRYTVT